MIIKKYFSFLLCILILYFTSSENTFCYAREIDYLCGNRVHNRPCGVPVSIFNVLDFGAIGDGETDDTQAFLKAWDAACKVQGRVMLIPSGFTFLLHTVTFDGDNCQPSIIVQLDGIIVAPPDKSDWKKTDIQWILFSGLKGGITIQGNGVIDGRGRSWWAGAPKLPDDDNVLSSDTRPHVLRIVLSTNVIVTGITIKNSPRMHIFIDSSQNLQIFNFTASSPGDSPNTDGIHITSVKNVDIHNSTLSCGDDCVSIQKGCSNVTIYDVDCGPGHGYSIGGLAPNKTEAHVSDIAIFNSTAKDSLTGVRIKTWQDGKGSVNNVTFANITMTDVKTPITIDQQYCNGFHNCVATTKNAVAIFDITYSSIRGTYTDTSVSLNCSIYQPCHDLTLSDIALLPSVSVSGRRHPVGRPKDKPFCSNAYGRVLTVTTPRLDTCVLSEISPPPAMPPILSELYDIF